MATNDLYREFIEKLKKNKTPEEAANFLAELMKLGSAQLHYTIMTILTDEDMEAINKIPNDQEAIEEMKRRFKIRTGVTPEEFVLHVRDEIAKNYLFPALNQNTKKN